MPPRSSSSSIRRTNSNANSSNAPTSPNTLSAPDQTPDMREGAISEANKLLLDEQLSTVERVIDHIASKSLSNFEAVLYIMRNSVDVQRIATLEQLHLRLGDEVLTKSIGDKNMSMTTGPLLQSISLSGLKVSGSRHTHEYVLTTLCLSASMYSPQVQGACAKGISECIPSLAPATRRRIYSHIALALFSVHEASSEKWIQLYLSATKHLDEHDIRTIVLPKMKEYTLDTTSTRRRIVGCRLAVGVCDVVPSLALGIIPLFESLVGDPDKEVRLALATSVSMPLLSCLPQVVIRESLLTSLLVPLLLDTHIPTSIAIYNTLVDFCAVADPLFMRHCLSRILQEYTLNPPPSVEAAVFKGFGKFIWHFRGCLTPSDYRPLVHLFCGMCAHTSSSCRVQCAFNFPAMFATLFELRVRNNPALVARVSDLKMNVGAEDASVNQSVAERVETYNRDDESLSLLVQRLGLLVEDPSTSVRHRISAGFHELLNLALSQRLDLMGSGDTPDAFDETKQSSALLLLAELQSLGLKLLSDPDIKVRQSTFAHFDIFLKCTKVVFGESVKALQSHLNDKVLPMLMFHETSISSNYRLVADFLPHFRLFPQYFTHDALDRHMVPRLVSHLITGAAAIKEDVAVTIALTVRGTSPRDYDERIALQSLRLVQNLAQHASSTYRTALVWIARGFLEVFSARYFGMYFLPALVRLASDPVVCVRSALVSLTSMTTPGTTARKLLGSSVVPILVQDADSILRKRAAVLARAETRPSRRSPRRSDFSSLCDVIAAPKPKGVVSAEELAKIEQLDDMKMKEEGRLIQVDFMEAQRGKIIHASTPPTRSLPAPRPHIPH